MNNTHPSLSAWAEQLRPGTIVLFRFPERHDRLAGKRRPCLVLGKREGPTGLQIALGYGTSATTAANRGFDLEISAGRDCQIAGLARPSRFVLARRITVSANDARFHRGTCDNPIIGRLPGHRMNEFSSLIAGLGDRIFDDQFAGASHRRSTKRYRTTPRHKSGSVIMHRREILVPARQPRGQERTGAHTVIVEHRGRRMLRPTPSAA